MECIKSDEIVIDQHEHFIKQTFRNRCIIDSPNGPQTLVIPVVHQNLNRTPMKDIKISYESQWKKIHWRAICTSYRNTPFFEFYEEKFRNIFEERFENLLDLNMKFLETILNCLKVKKQILFTESFEKDYIER